MGTLLVMVDPGLRHRLRYEVPRFGVVGVVAFGVDVLVFNLVRVLVDPSAAKVVSVLLATVVSWAGSHWWTFRKRSSSRRAGTELGLFALINAVGLLISLACLLVSREVLGLTSVLADNVSANVVGVLVLGTLFRFWAYRSVVFRQSGERQRVEHSGTTAKG